MTSNAIKTGIHLCKKSTVEIKFSNIYLSGYLYTLHRYVLKLATRVFTFTVFFYGLESVSAAPVSHSRAYYVNASGSDENAGGKNSPFKTIAMINGVELHPGDSVLLAGGQTFHGTLYINNKSGTSKKPIIISSYGRGFASIQSDKDGALELNTAKYIRLSDLSLKGAGRKDGNIKNGVLINKCTHITIKNLDISGFQKAGLLVYSSTLISMAHIRAYENGFAGISIEGEYGHKDSRDIYIADCRTENNPGDPSNLKNHSGSGIVVGHSTKVTVEYCVASNNGWDMPRIGNGPVGIWCYEADSVMIRYCISYGNKTAKGADDGGGFDLDGGVTYSTIQHCLSYDNYGSAFGIFQYAGATPWHHNTIRNNISENDGSVSAAQAAVYIWNSSGDETQFADLAFYNNIIYNARGSVIHYADKQSRRSRFRFYKNTFVGKDELIKGTVTGDFFSGNTWWSLEGGFNIDSTKDFKTWARKTGKEQRNGKLTGLNKEPHFKNAGHASLTDPHKLKSWTNYELVHSTEVKRKNGNF
ncbi:MAG: right-handed parallel beta-helix repeat-containing protein [Ginsengibacter sp.]